MTRVMLNSAWVTESWSSRARWARSWLEASSPAWRRRSVLEALALADVAGRAVDAGERAVDVVPSELTSTGTVDPSRRIEDQAHDLASSGRATISASQRSSAVGSDRSSTIREKCPPTSSSGLNPTICSIVSETNVKLPSTSVEKTTSGEFSTRNR